MDAQVDQVLLRVRPALLPAGDWAGTLRLLAGEAAEAMGEGVDAARVYADAYERELADTTYIGMGVAVPHARVEGLSRAGLYAALSRPGIAWPHESAHLVALLVAPWEAPEMHLQLLSRLVRWRRKVTEPEMAEWAEAPKRLAESLTAAFADLL